MNKSIEIRYIKVNVNGSIQEKTYSTESGYKNALGRIDKSDIIEHGVIDANLNRKPTEKTKEKLLGPVDLSHSANNGSIIKTFVHSNWNPKLKIYTSRLYSNIIYNSEGKHIYFIMEPDGYISLRGAGIVTIRKDGVRVSSDGREFDQMGHMIM